MNANRKSVAQSASQRLAAADLTSLPATIGLDGFVDEIIAMVDTRSDFQTYTPIPSIAALGAKITAAAGQSSNYELVVKQMKLGGNGPIMANALAAAGMPVTYIGATGYPGHHAVFNEFAERATLIGVCEPAHTDAIEFSDGKLMLGKLTPLSELAWEVLLERVGLAKFTALLQQSKLIAFNNWTMIPRMSHMLQSLTDQVLPTLTGPRRQFFIDLADPEKRTREDLRNILTLLSVMQKYLDVTLGLNLKESVQAAEVLNIAVDKADPEPGIEPRAKTIRAQLGISCVVIHPRKGAAAADSTGASATFQGPFVQEPKISTGAGDHFNAGFALARAVGLSLPESLATGVATSGYYVREALSPTKAQLADFLANLPEPQ